jgi:hypothetical protein
MFSQMTQTPIVLIPLHCHLDHKKKEVGKNIIVLQKILSEKIALLRYLSDTGYVF